MESTPSGITLAEKLKKDTITIIKKIVYGTNIILVVECMRRGVSKMIKKMESG